MNDMSAPDAVPYRITNPERIPAKRYYDEEFYRLECERLWPHVWQMACRLEEIPDVGDYVEYRNLDKSVIVVRTKSGVKAFYNTCRHRGVQLVTGHGNCQTKGLICPFHGWRWNMEGENTFVFSPHIFSPEQLEQAEIDLKPCRVEFWGGWAFINWDDDAPPLLECLGPVAERLNSRNIDQLKMEWWYGTVLPANWKLAMEAFMEAYHVMKTHPQLQSLAPIPYYSAGPDQAQVKQMSPRLVVDNYVAFLDRLSIGMAGMVHGSEVEIAREVAADMAMPDDIGEAIGAFITKLKDEIHRRGLERGVAMPDLNKVDAENPASSVEYIFPHFFVLPFMSAASTYRIRPLGPESCLFEIWSLAMVTDEERGERPREPTMLPYDSKEFPEIPEQDYANIPLQQLGLHGFDYMRLSKDYEGLISNYQRLIDGYIAGEDPGKLAKASQLVNDGYEHPIVDIGL